MRGLETENGGWNGLHTVVCRQGRPGDIKESTDDGVSK